MSKFTAGILGLVTIGSALVVVVSTLVYGDLVPRVDDPTNPPGFVDRVRFYNLAAIGFLLVAYMVYLFATPAVPKQKRARWFLLMLLGNLLAMPVFWYRYVWRNARDGHASGS